MTKEYKCNAAAQNGWLNPDLLKEYQEHSKTCKDCQKVNEEIKVRAFDEVIKDIFGGF